MQNRLAKNVISSGQYEPSAPPRAILRLAARAARPHNAGRKTRTITEKKRPFCSTEPRGRDAAGDQRRAKSSPHLGKTREILRENRPLLWRGCLRGHKNTFHLRHDEIRSRKEEKQLEWHLNPQQTAGSLRSLSVALPPQHRVGNAQRAWRPGVVTDRVRLRQSKASVIEVDSARNAAHGTQFRPAIRPIDDFQPTRSNAVSGAWLESSLQAVAGPPRRGLQRGGQKHSSPGHPIPESRLPSPQQGLLHDQTHFRHRRRG